jgi:hypothetical protein
MKSNKSQSNTLILGISDEIYDKSMIAYLDITRSNILRCTEVV